MIPNASNWDVEHWKYSNYKLVELLTDEQLLTEWKELTQAIQLFYKYRVNMTMEMSWLFSTIVSIATKRKLNLNIEDGDKAG